MAIFPLFFKFKKDEKRHFTCDDPTICAMLRMAKGNDSIGAPITRPVWRG
jgi:hypothetical protein